MTNKMLVWIAFLPSVPLCFAVIVAAQTRPRARELGIAPGIYSPGRLNAITDVGGVLVGHTTVIEGDDVRTGVTAILPHGGNLFQEKVAGGVFVGNAFGKLAGSTQVIELGTIETPIVLTNTLSVGVAMDAVVRYTLGRPGNEQVRSVNALVGETNDGSLNDIRGFHITQQHVLEAITKARDGPVKEGSVGAGTGTMAYGWKGGIGTSSRTLPSGYVVGVLAQTNFGGNLTIAGVPIFRMLQPRGTIAGVQRSGADRASGDGSCMLVVATDAPLDARDLGRLAARAVFGLGRTGSRTPTEAATSRSPSQPHPKCEATSARPSLARDGCCRLTRCPPFSRRRWKQPRKPCTTRYSRRRP